MLVGGETETEVGIARLVAHLAKGDHGFILDGAFTGCFIRNQYGTVDDLVLIVQDVLELEGAEVERDIECSPITLFVGWCLAEFQLPIGKVNGRAPV